MKGLLFIILMGASVQAIRIHNTTSYDLYAAPYYFDLEAEQVGDIKRIDAGETVSFERPEFSVRKKRKVLFSQFEEDLKPTLSSSAYHLMPRVSIGIGNDFFLYLVKGTIKGYNALEWWTYVPLKENVGGVIDKLDAATLGKLRKSYFSGEPTKEVQVREGTDLPLEEVQFLTRRMPKVQEALSDLLGRDVPKRSVPSIMVAGSGGGYRAMLGFLGLLKGAQETGLFDTFSHVSGLSGSTWALGPWISSGWSLKKFERRLVRKLEASLTSFTPNMSSMISNLSTRLLFNQPLSAVNIFGRIIGYNLLSDLPGGPFGIYLHEQAKAIKKGSLPFPIYTAVSTKLPYQWVEFTPYEFGGDYFGGYIPTRNFGAPFLNGKMVDQTPSYPLSYILAICGSAFTARLQRVLQEQILPKIPFESIRNAIEYGTEELRFGKYRISPARVFNWTWGMRPFPRAQQEIIKLIDGGLSYNFGLEALYRRYPDFILIGDFSATQEGSELKKAEKELRERGFKVPPIDYTNINERPFSIFKDPTDPTVPVIIYLPQIYNENFSEFDPATCKKSWCSTFNFVYPQEDAQKLIGLARQSMIDAAPEIKEELNQWIDRQG